ncbi:extracellular solute-binding protein [bacterium]|nr:extracellular solute-binding protein [bacterium]
MFEAFEESTGIDVQAVFLNEGSLPARLASNADNADLYITTDLSQLATAKDQGYTQPIRTGKIRTLPRGFVDGGGHYAAISFRGRTIVYNPKKVDVKTLRGYDDLADPEYKGRVCIRPFTHVYNVTMVSEMIADRGEDYARRWVNGVKNNLAVKPNGNDRNQAKLVSQGVCDLGLMNTYYYGLLMSNKAQRPIANATELFFPNQSEKGTYTLYSGVAMAKNAKHTKEAIQLIDYLLGNVSQNYIAQSTFEYPANPKIKLSVIAEGFGEGQPGIEKGRAKFAHMNPATVAKHRETAAKILAEASK